MFKAKSSFETHRAILYEMPDPDPFPVIAYRPLAEVLQTRTLQPHEHVLVASIGEEALVLPTLSMIYYHVAQGQWNGIAWMASFCVLCNAGSVFDARVDATPYHFAAQGFYESMVLIADQETRSYWNHITGLCLYGPLAGTQMERLASLLQMTAADALAAYPNATLPMMPMAADAQTEAQRLNAVYRLPATPKMNPTLAATLTHADTRLPRYDMGLGLWTGRTQRYYPVTTLYAQHNALIDTVDGRSVVVVLDEDVTLPIAFYAEATQLEFRGAELLLTAETSYHKGVLRHNGVVMPLERPNQSAIRWYAFASLFPECEIYART